VCCSWNLTARLRSSLLMFVCAALLLAPETNAGGQAPAVNNLPPPVQLTAEQDHQRLLDLLHITALRRGPDGDPKSPNAANVDPIRWF